MLQNAASLDVNVYAENGVYDHRDFTATIVKWFPERHFGFAEADDGYRFFVHISQFSNGSVSFDKSGM